MPKAADRGNGDRVGPRGLVKRLRREKRPEGGVRLVRGRSNLLDLSLELFDIEQPHTGVAPHEQITVAGASPEMVATC